MTERDWLLGIRRILLEAVDLIERKLGLERTAELRALVRKERQAVPVPE